MKKSAIVFYRDAFDILEIYNKHNNNKNKIVDFMWGYGVVCYQLPRVLFTLLFKLGCLVVWTLYTHGPASEVLEQSCVDNSTEQLINMLNTTTTQLFKR